MADASATDPSTELRAQAERVRDAAKTANTAELQGQLDSLEAAAQQLARAWSGSNLGYHARVYYADFAEVPPGAAFSAEWGAIELAFSNPTRGDWREYTRDTVWAAVDALSGGVSLAGAHAAIATMSHVVDHTREEALSVLLSDPTFGHDEYLATLRGQLQKVDVTTAADFVRFQLPSQMMSRDMRALEGGREAAVHQEVLAAVVAARASFNTAEQLAVLLERAASHIERRASRSRRRITAESILGDRVFIGHGHSQAWRELKDFLQDRLTLPWDEFNRVPVAGVTNVARLNEMLDTATISFHVLTAEDERTDGAMLARQNVVHEAGLFQGRLGFTRAIVLLEEGCEEFSNIAGLGQIRFPQGRISAAFEEVRRVLEREGVIEPPAAQG